MSDADRWAVVERIYHEAVERPVADRPAFLDSACAGDVALRHELESLLANDSASLLDKSALDVAARQDPQSATPSWVGRTIRHYDIVALIGAGGMGEVYRARDTSLGRDVALKLLPREVSADPERLRRLEREARILASLNHTRIATLHGLEECDGQRFLVMELVPGQTLSERLRHGALPIRDALDVCRQIADGLEAAHEAGVVHRDLKPANIKVTPDGRVKLLDFGLAKALDTTPSGIDPTLTASEATREGTVLGTPAYMSPEQARGQPVDRRTDIWAFGCCLYECLTGRSAFKGNTVTDTLAAVLDKDPDWSALGDSIPLIARRLLRRCLAKDMRHRLQHIGDARLELEETGTDTIEPSARARWSLRAAPALLAGAVLITVGAVLASWLEGRRATAVADPPVARLELKLADATTGNLHLLVLADFTPFALSPDGRRVVFRTHGPAGSRLYVRELSGYAIRPLPGTETAVTSFFSPDGQWIAFWQAEHRILRKVSLGGGSPIPIGPTDVPRVAVWGANDEIVFDTAFPKAELWSIPASGGAAKPIAVRDRSDGERISLRARVPRSNDLLVASIGPGGTWLDVLSRETGRRRRLLRGGRNSVAHFTRSGHLVYADADALFAVALDDQSTPVGAPIPVLHGIDHYRGHSNLAVAENGTVVYLPAEHIREAELSWRDREGNVTPVPGGRGPCLTVAVSPNGREAACTMVDGSTAQVWIIDLERGAKRLLVSEGNHRSPIWSRDGAFITYVANRGDTQDLYRKRADGTGAEQLLARGSRWPTPEDWSPDGRTLLFSDYTSHGDSDVWAYSSGKVAPLIAGPFNEGSARFSPDGRFIAFAADDGGVSRVYVQSFPGPGPRTTVSDEESGGLQWRADGRELSYWSGERTMVVAVQTNPVLRLGRPQVVDDAYQRGYPGLTTDGRRLRLSPRTTEGPPELRIILNWFEELERLAPHPRK